MLGRAAIILAVLVGFAAGVLLGHTFQKHVARPADEWRTTHAEH
jgi:predicted Co/Zn/Cd cation transporter (cation efflux family)